MDDAAGMGVGERLTELTEDGEVTRQIVGGRLALPEQVAESAALDELHGEEWPAVVEPADLVYRRDSRVLQLAGELRLLEKAILQLWMHGGVQEHLEGERPLDVGVVGAVDDTHAAAPDFADDLIAAGSFREG